MIPKTAFDRALEQWLEAVAPTARPAGLHESVIKRAATMRQRPAWFAALRVGGFRRSPRRFVMTQPQFRLATAAVIGVLVVGGSLYLIQRGQPSVGSPSSSPTLRSSPTPAPQSSLGAPMAIAAGATTTLLADGRVLMAGGYVYENVLVNGSIGKYNVLNSAWLYDPATRTFTPTGSLTTARYFHSATLLSNGRVLITGGNSADGPPLRSAELYDPTTGTFSPTGSMTDARYVDTAVRLEDGRVLIAGHPSAPPPGQSAELYDPATGTFSPTGAMAFALAVGGFEETATLLADGRVLVAGGGVDLGVCSASAEIFDPKTNTFSPTGSMTAPRCGTATLLQDGRVLMTAGVQWPSSSGRTNQSSAEIFDPKTGTFSPTGPPADGGTRQTATLLADGRVLVAGGTVLNTDSPLASAELYDPATGTFSPTGSMAVAREGHTATLLSDGRVLVTGGWSSSSFEGLVVTPAEIYDPATGAFSPAG